MAVAEESVTSDHDGKRGTAPLHVQYTAQVGACGKSRVIPHHQRPQAGRYGNRSLEMRVLSTPADLPRRAAAQPRSMRGESQWQLPTI